MTRSPQPDASEWMAPAPEARRRKSPDDAQKASGCSRCDRVARVAPSRTSACGSRRARSCASETNCDRAPPAISSTGTRTRAGLEQRRLRAGTQAAQARGQGLRVVRETRGARSARTRRRVAERGEDRLRKPFVHEGLDPTFSMRAASVSARRQRIARSAGVCDARARAHQHQRGHALPGDSPRNRARAARPWIAEPVSLAVPGGLEGRSDMVSRLVERTPGAHDIGGTTMPRQVQRERLVVRSSDCATSAMLCPVPVKPCSSTSVGPRPWRRSEGHGRSPAQVLMQLLAHALVDCRVKSGVHGTIHRHLDDVSPAVERARERLLERSGRIDADRVPPNAARQFVTIEAVAPRTVLEDGARHEPCRGQVLEDSSTIIVADDDRQVAPVHAARQESRHVVQEGQVAAPEHGRPASAAAAPSAAETWPSMPLTPRFASTRSASLRGPANRSSSRIAMLLAT